MVSFNKNKAEVNDASNVNPAPAPEELASAAVNNSAGTAVSTALADIDIMADSGLGQNFTTEDLAIQRLGIVQMQSKALIKGSKEYIEGATPGQMYDNVTKQLWSGEKGLLVIPVSYRRTLLEWVPVKLGGVFVKDWGEDESILQKTTLTEGKNILPDGHEIVETAEYYTFTVNPETGATGKGVLSMASTQWSKAKRWNTMMNQLEVPVPGDPDKLFNPAAFYRSYLLTTQPESNKQGHWFGWVVTPSTFTLELKNGRNIYLKARQFFADVKAGAVKVAEHDQGNFAGGGEVDENAPM